MLPTLFPTLLLTISEKSNARLTTTAPPPINDPLHPSTMQRQPESSKFLSSEMTNKGISPVPPPSRADSITIDCLSADLYENMLQMSLSASCDSFGGIVLDDDDDLGDDDDDRKLSSLFVPLASTKTRSSIVRHRRSSSALMRSIESFDCSFSSLKIDVQPSHSNTMETPSVVTTVEDPLDEDDVAVNAEVVAAIEEAEFLTSSPSGVLSASPPSPLPSSPDLPVSLMVSSVLPPRPISICSSTSSSRASSSSSSSNNNSDDSDENTTAIKKTTAKKSTKKTARNTTMTVSTLAGETVTLEGPGPYEVICGRNSSGQNHIGNRRLQISISMNLDRYIAAPSREDKTRVVQQLAGTLIEIVGCRFLKKIGKGQFVEMDRRQIKEKIGHSFRDLANLKKKGGYNGNKKFLD
mmetsp:Transcript_17556/g.42703  ORF Transcript_17556/g.42703 Transcript_17556/m.42703 type:complete len:409 (+) Transcript_17556:41-1267(+)